MNEYYMNMNMTINSSITQPRIVRFRKNFVQSINTTP